MMVDAWLAGVGLDRSEDEPVELVAGGKVIARAELLHVGERLALRIVEVAGEPAQDRARSVG